MKLLTKRLELTNFKAEYAEEFTGALNDPKTGEGVMTPTFTPGTNIAVKVPAHEYDSTVAFYRDILGLKPVELESPDNYESIAFEFGDKNLWVDKISGISQAEIWLEIKTDDIQKAKDYLEEKGVARRDEIEPLPETAH